MTGEPFEAPELRRAVEEGLADRPADAPPFRLPDLRGHYAPTAHPGTCAHCKRRREVYSCQRFGGGSYRRGGRYYRSSICGDCAVSLIRYLPYHAGGDSSGFSGSTLRDIVAIESPDALIQWTAERDRRRALDEARRQEARRS